jgi:hypothetical protein
MAECKNCVVGILGVCSFEYCRTEREVLLEQALELTGQGGHTLSEFVKVKGYPIWQAHCLHCRQSVAINLDPRPGERDVSGRAISAPCPGPASVPEGGRLINAPG